MSEQNNAGNQQGQFFAGDQKKAVITATKFLQSEIAKYLGNDGILTPDEEAELDDLKVQLGVGDTSYARLKKLAQQELFYFRRDDVLGFKLDRVDRPKLYVDAERISIRISLVDRWIKELDDLVTTVEDKKDKLSRTKLTINLWKWVHQDLWDEFVNGLVDNTLNLNTLNLHTDDFRSKFKSIDKSLNKSCSKGESQKEPCDYNFAESFKRPIFGTTSFYEKIEEILGKKEIDKKSTAKELYTYMALRVLEFLNKAETNKDNKGVLKFKIFEESLRNLSIPSLTNEDAVNILYVEYFKFIFKYNGFSKEEYLKTIKKALNDPNNDEESWALDLLKFMGEDERVNKDKLVISDIQKLIEQKVEPEKKDAMNPEKHYGPPVLFLLIVIGALYIFYAVFFTQIMEFKDSRDGSEYRMTEIGGIKWMAENLRYKTKTSLESSHGNLYKWEEAIMACPVGWRLPTQEEWQQLVDSIGGPAMGRQLKSRKWDKKATDSTEFTAFADGFANPLISETINEKGVSAQWWTYTLQNPNEALFVKMQSDDDSILIQSSKIEMAYSVRCVKIDSNFVKPRKSPASTSENTFHVISGVVESFKLQNDVWIPVIRQSNGKKVLPYTPDQYKSIVLLKNNAGNGDIVANIKDGITPLMEKSKASDRPLFLQGSTVSIKRLFEKSFTSKKNLWQPDSIWILDSVSVQGTYELSELNAIGDVRCDAKYEASLEQDSLTIVNLNKPCSELQVGWPYKLTINFTLKYNQQNKENSELKYLVHRIVDEKMTETKKE